MRFDADALEVRGDPKPVLSGLLSSGGALGSGVSGTGAAQVSIADNGTAAYLAGEMMAETTPLRLAIVDRGGRRLYEHPESRLFRDPRLSPDGTRIAVRVDATTGAPQLYLLDTQRRTLNQITFDAGSASPIWSHDGRSLAFAFGPSEEALTVHLMPSDGTGDPKPLTQDGADAVPSSFSPDDRLIAIARRNVSAPSGRPNSDIEVVSVADGTVTPFLNSSARESQGAFSPDGKWMAFLMVDASGIGNVYVRGYPGGGSLRKVSTAGGIEPHWTLNGREIVFLDFEGQVTAVDVSPEGDALVLGNPRRLFDLPVAQVSDATTFDAAADGSRFVMLVNEAQQASIPKRTSVTVVFNFLEEVRRATAGAAR